MKNALRTQISNSMKQYHRKLRHNKDFNDLSRNSKKLVVLEEQNYECLCGQGTVWDGKPLVLQLDHINGDSSNYERENLRMLCPNCHTQTLTYGSKMISGEKKRQMCRGFTHGRR